MKTIEQIKEESAKKLAQDLKKANIQVELFEKTGVEFTVFDDE